VDLSWSAPNNSPVKIVGYNIYRSAPDNSSSQRLNLSAVTQTTYVDSTVQSGQFYKYVVKSVDASGVESAPSNTFSLTDTERVRQNYPKAPAWQAFILKLHVSTSKPGLQFAVQMPQNGGNLRCEVWFKTHYQEERSL
jgi:fibronectin type 3 domain-containing protein